MALSEVRVNSDRNELGWQLLTATLYATGLILTLAVGLYRSQGKLQFWQFPEQRTLVILTVAAYALSLLAVRYLANRPAYRLMLDDKLRLSVAVGVATCGFALLVFALELLDINAPAGYALTAYGVFLVVTLAGQLLHDRSDQLRVALVPLGRITEVLSLDGVRWQQLSEPGTQRPDAVAVDLHNSLTPEWRNFLADCQLKRVPVFHVGTVYERLTGKVSLRYLRSPVLADIRPTRFHAILKRTIELIVVVAALPFVLPLMLLTALAIRLETPGPVLFWQERVGLKGKTFQMVKFRSMTWNAEDAGPKFATHSDPRVTRVGKVIRKFRLDELPQLYNVLRGDMALIGPRPEQVMFAREFEKTIPFYRYRHLVRPGLTGWAQVRGGYAGCAEETEEKLRYDLYYVKNMSPWLDLVVVIHTIRTILTGFGAR